MSSPNGTHSTDGAAQLRWGVYALLIALAVGNLTGRLLSVNAVNRADLQKHLIRQDLQRTEQRLKEKNLSAVQLEAELDKAREKILRNRQLERPFLSANDRSRWLAIRSLVEHGTYEIDAVLDRNVWNTIDMVQHRGDDGELHLYSSKPPLLYTLIAGEYWIITKLTGMTLGTHPYEVGRLMLMTINVLPLALMFYLIAKLAERLGTTDWGKVFVVAAASLGTMLSTFAVVLNNHTVAAVSATIALYAFVRIWCDGETRTRYYVLAGLFSAFTAANELPALAFLALVALGLWFCDRRGWWIGFVPATMVVIVAFFGTNYIAHGCWTPPYMHKSSDDPEENWYVYTYTIDGVERESYWQNRQGIDVGEPSKWTYALHTTIGHHGIFSLTPVWLLSAVGMLIWLRGADSRKRWLAVSIGVLTLVCLVFYIFLRPQVDRNYGGMTSGLRWMFWFVPLWLLTMLPAADWFARSKLRQSIALVLLIVSVISVSYPTWNPWTHPWLYNWLDYLNS